MNLIQIKTDIYKDKHKNDYQICPNNPSVGTNETIKLTDNIIVTIFQNNNSINGQTTNGSEKSKLKVFRSWVLRLNRGGSKKRESNLFTRGPPTTVYPVSGRKTSPQ